MYNKLICISNRSLCNGDFTQRIRDILDMGIPVVLREKDLSETEYFRLLKKINRPEITAHSFTDAAREFGCTKIHLPLPMLETADVSGFDTVGASTHSVLQAQRAEALGATYITAGHIYETDCKKGLSPHGTDLLRDIKSKTKIPVYALGGINAGNAAECIKSGADGVCTMSGFMHCPEIAEYIKKYRHILG